MTLHRESATFIDPRDGWMWEIDLTFLASAWKCIYGCGCKGTKGTPAAGCCTEGVFIQAHEDDEPGAEDFEKISARVEQLTADDWDLRDRYRDDWHKERDKGSRHTRVHGGMCVFQNRGEGSSGTTGCAFHVAALRRGEDPLDWKPFVCGLVPFALDHDEDEATHTLRAYHHERDWGSGEREPGLLVPAQHDDLHAGNLYPQAERMRVLDWGDASISHPFASLVVTFQFLEEVNKLPPTDPWFARLRDAYLEPWGRGLGDTFALAMRVGTFAHTIAWVRQRNALPAEARPEFDNVYSIVLRRAVAQTFD